MSGQDSFMKRALTCAKKAAALGEIPVGAVVVRDGKVIATGYNRREKDKSVLLHAEMIALHRACKAVGGWRLSDCDLYVTLEPCPMCAGAVINARIRRVYIGAMDPKGGCMGSLCDLTQLPFNHRPEVIRGVMKEECESVLSTFFGALREKKKEALKAVSLRPFTAADVPLLKQYLYPNKSKADLEAMVSAWKTRVYEGKYCEFFAVTVENVPVGYVNLLEASPDSVSVGAHIFPGFRGKTYGTQAVRSVLGLAAEKGYSAATARVRKTNTPSLRLCDTVGLISTGEDVTAQGREVFTFRKELKK